MIEKVPLTPLGFKALEDERKQLLHVERPAIIRAIEEARALGDLSENAEYHAAKERQGFIEGRLQELDSLIGRADVIDPKTLSGKVVRFGATLSLQDEEEDKPVTYKIVGTVEANIHKGLLPIDSPVARALIGKEEGDLVEVRTPNGSKTYEILKVEFK